MQIIKGKDGIKYKVISQNDLIGKYIRLKGEYEPELRQATELLIANKKGLIVDIGANIGTYCIPLAKKFPAQKIIAFEVQQTIFSVLKENIAINRVRNVQAVHGGISDRTETITASIPDYRLEANIGAFSLDEEVRKNNYGVQTTGGTETFSVKPLDDYHLKNVALIKIDVEGMELKVLKGAEKTLAASKFPPILFEAWTQQEFYQPRRNELFLHLQALGYEITSAGENNFAQHTSHPDPVKLRVRYNPNG